MVDVVVNKLNVFHREKLIEKFPPTDSKMIYVIADCFFTMKLLHKKSKHAAIATAKIQDRRSTWNMKFSAKEMALPWVGVDIWRQSFFLCFKRVSEIRPKESNKSAQDEEGDDL